MGALTSPLILSIGSSAGQIPEASSAESNLCTDGYNIGFKWTQEGAPNLASVNQYDNGFVPVFVNTPNGITSRLRSTAAINLYTTTSIPPLATDRINCFSVDVLKSPIATISRRARFEATLAPSARVFSIDIDPVTGMLIAKSAGLTMVGVQSVVLPLFGGVENVTVYRIFFALDVGADLTAVLRVYPNVGNAGAGAAIFGGAMVAGQVSQPVPFIPSGSRLAGQIPRQVATPNYQHKTNAGVYNIDPIADQDTWIECTNPAGNIVAFSTTGLVQPDAPTGSRILITQSPAAIGGITTVQSAGPNTIISPGGATAAFTNLTFPSADFPNVTQMLFVKTSVANEWMILETSAGGSSGGLFLQAGAGAVAYTFQNKDRQQVSARDFAALGNNVAVDTVPYQAALNSGALDITPINVTGYKSAALVIPATIKSISGQRYYQTAKNADMLQATGRTGLRLSDLELYGIADGGAFAANNNPVNLVNCTDVRLHNIFSQGWNGPAVKANGVSNSVFSQIIGKANSDGIRYSSCNNIITKNASLYAPQTATFIAGFALDSTDGGNTTCFDITFDGCNVKDFANAQAYLIHSGYHISINGGNLDNVLIGVGITQFNNTDLIQDIAINGVNTNCTSTAGGAAAAVAITAFGFDNTHMAENITISGGNSRNANNMATVQSVDNGAVEAQYINGLTIIGHNISGGKANGYALYRRVQDLTLIGGRVADVAVFAGESNGIRLGESGSGWMACTGSIAMVNFQNVNAAIRLTVSAPAACGITRAGTTATVHKVAHGYVAGDWVRIAGVTYGIPATFPDQYYNGAFQVAAVIGPDDFTYIAAGVPSTSPAPGAPTVEGSYDGLSIHDNIYNNVTTRIINADHALVDGVRHYNTGDASPYVGGNTRQMTVANAAASWIASFREGRLGQQVTFVFSDANTTIIHGGGIQTVGGGNIASANQLKVTFTCTDETLGANVWIADDPTTAA